MATVPQQIRLMAERWPGGCACQVADGPSMSYGEWEATANRLAGRWWTPGSNEAIRWCRPSTTMTCSPTSGVPGGAEGGRVLRDPADVSRRPRAAGPGAAGGAGGAAGQLRRPAGSAERGRGNRQPPGDGDHGADTGSSVMWEAFLAEDDRHLQVPVSGDDPADVIHTSGTTGRAHAAAGPPPQRQPAAARERPRLHRRVVPAGAAGQLPGGPGPADHGPGHGHGSAVPALHLRPRGVGRHSAPLPAHRRVRGAGHRWKTSWPAER
jgi:hypothetical protein